VARQPAAENNAGVISATEQQADSLTPRIVLESRLSAPRRMAYRPGSDAPFLGLLAGLLPLRREHSQPQGVLVIVRKDGAAGHHSVARKRLTHVFLPEERSSHEHT
jgi:hypothetical protein